MTTTPNRRWPISVVSLLLATLCALAQSHRTQCCQASDMLTLPDRSPVWALTFFHDGQALVALGQRYRGKSQVALWSGHGRSMQMSGPPFAEWIDVVGVSGNAKTVVGRSATRLYAVDITVVPPRLKEVKDTELLSVVAMGSKDDIYFFKQSGELARWSLASNVETHVTIGGGKKTAICVSSDGNNIAVGTRKRNGVFLFDFVSRQYRQVCMEIDWVTALAFGPANDCIAIGSANGEVLLYPTICRRSARRLQSTGGRVSRLAFSSDGRRLLAIGAGTQIKPGNVFLWNVENATRVNLDRTRTSDCSRPENSVTFSPDGRSLAVAGCDAGIDILDCTTGRLVARNEEFPKPLWSLVYSPDGQTLACGGDDGVVRSWLLKNKQPK